MQEIKMPQLNLTVISGYLVKDPTLRHTSGGVPVSNFSIAHTKRFKDNTGIWKEETCYIGVVAWHKLAESCYEFLRKGKAVLITGNLQSRSVEFNDGTMRNIIEIKASKIQFLNKLNDMEKDIETLFEEGDELPFKNDI